MAYNGNNNYNNRPQNYNNRPQNYNSGPQKSEPKDLPEDYVDIAEKHMSNCYRMITTSKMRNLLSLVTDCFQFENRRTGDAIEPESQEALDALRTRVVYEMGRDGREGQDVKQFVRETELLSYLKGIRGRRKALLRFFHYMEALVAYHKYYGGRER